MPKRLPFEYEGLGEQEVKGFEDPVRVYEVTLKSGAAVPSQDPRVAAAGAKPAWRTLAGAVVAVLIVMGGGLLWWQPWVPTKEPAPAEVPASRLPEKPSVAVLPFTNLSDDAEQEYFADGMTDDLITDLSKLSGVFVIARNSVFTYKGKAVRVEHVARELGVRYILEGSVRRVGGKMRINAQLIDAATGGHLWAERYDGDDSDIFALQDRVIGKIISALQVTLTDTEEAQLARIPTNDFEAYDYFLRARRGLWVWSSEGRRDALILYQRAIALDAQFAEAYAGIARVASTIWQLRESHVLPPAVARKIAYQAAGKALELDPRNAQAYSVLAYLQVAEGRTDEALQSVTKAVSLSPNDVDINADLAKVLVYAGQPVEALTAMETVFQLESEPTPLSYADLGWVLFSNRQYEKAIVPLEKGLEGGVEHFETLAKTYARLGRLDEAKAMVARIVERFPGASLVDYRNDESEYYKRHEDLAHSIESLRLAGLPEWPFGYEARAEHRLDDAAIEAVTFGQTWTGRDIVNLGSFIQETSKDGKVAFRSGYALVTGRAWVERDRLCLNFPTTYKNRKRCTYLFRNPQGTAEEQNEYVLLGTVQIFEFSITTP
jgi:adenylate cyclase